MVMIYFCLVHLHDPHVARLAFEGKIVRSSQVSARTKPFPKMWMIKATAPCVQWTSRGMSVAAPYEVIDRDGHIGC